MCFQFLSTFRAMNWNILLSSLTPNSTNLLKTNSTTCRTVLKDFKNVCTWYLLAFENLPQLHLESDTIHFFHFSFV